MPRGRRHRRRATPKVNGGRAKGRINTMEHRPCQMDLFSQESGSAWRQPKSRVDAIGRFRMVKKTIIRIGRQPRLDGTTVSRRRVNSNNSWSTTLEMSSEDCVLSFRGTTKSQRRVGTRKRPTSDREITYGIPRN
jgi:hypothetical protein